MLHWLRNKFHGSCQKISRSFSNRAANDPLSTQSISNTEMLVADSNIVTEQIKLHIISVDGSSWTIKTPQDLNIDALKAMALSHFYNPVESVKLLPCFKLISVSKKHVLQSSNSIQQEELSSDDEILLVDLRPAKPKENINDDNFKGPTQEEISSATAHLKPTNIVRIPPLVDCTGDFQTEMRKILISLVQFAAQLLSAREDADKTFALIVDKLNTREKIVPDAVSVRNLTDMGFPEDKVVLALRLKRNNATDALDWLLEKGASKMDVMNESLGDEREESNSSSQPTSITQSVDRLLATFQAFRHKEFRPNPDALKLITDMGFTDREAIEALRATGNNQQSACEWLLGGTRAGLEVDSGLDIEGPIYKALLDDPTIQMALNNPKMLLAFLAILENPHQASTWLNDPDVAPVLNQIFKTFHAEKHILLVNRHVEAFQPPHHS
ncbi:ubiquitin-associated domain-containing protein 1 [Nilaparvata lugens]|uniref:ubiquitin-associated domain-containing protein 1 n=1 Tax=Nilaparvata lugens TaxID=108931 RepID=UPI00193DAE66|nr:ubiquitin-associated domain-containing protein 1 [Nilaparvata lugens]